MAEVNEKDFTENLSSEDEALVKNMFEAGQHWGRSRSATHPKMKPYIFSTRGDVQVIDLAKTLEGLKAAEDFIKEVVRKGGTIMIVGTQPAAKQYVMEYGEKLKLPYVHEKWLGGTLTNIKTFLGRIEHMGDLEKKINSPDFEKYTKRERQKFTEEYEFLKKKFQGIRGITGLPQAIFLLGVSRHDTALKEAKKRRIPVVALVNTNDDPTFVDWPIPANDSATTSVKFMMERLAEVIDKARKSIPVEEKPVEEKKEESVPQAGATVA
jgi:small subunit ribosomal protein S2